MKTLAGSLSFALLALLSPTLPAGDAVITVHLDATRLAINPMMHGVFFEDINYAADGGLYAELIQNRSFENQEGMYAWTVVNRGADGTVKIESDSPLNPANPHYLRLFVERCR